MAYPPTIPPAGRGNLTAMDTNHPSDHNLISGALTDIVNELGTDPSGVAANLTTRLTTIEASVRYFVVANVVALPASPLDGDLVMVLSDGLIRRRSAGVWKIHSNQGGTGTLTWTASKASAIVTVTFPVAFTGTPSGIAACGPITNNTETTCNVRSVSNTNMTVQGYMASGGSVTTSVPFWWMAFEP